MLEVGQVVKDFTLKNSLKEQVKLTEVAQKYTIIFFYPKNNKISCTKEACSFNEYIEEFNALKTTVIGISMDGCNSHRSFKSQYGIEFILLSDAKKEITNYFGVINEETKNRRAKRITFILDENLKIIYRYDNVKPAHHGKEMLKIIKEIEKG